MSSLSSLVGVWADLFTCLLIVARTAVLFLVSGWDVVELRYLSVCLDTKEQSVSVKKQFSAFENLA